MSPLASRCSRTHALGGIVPDHDLDCFQEGELLSWPLLQAGEIFLSWDCDPSQRGWHSDVRWLTHTGYKRWSGLWDARTEWHPPPPALDLSSSSISASLCLSWLWLPPINTQGQREAAGISYPVDLSLLGNPIPLQVPCPAGQSSMVAKPICSEGFQIIALEHWLALLIWILLCPQGIWWLHDPLG